MICNPACGPCQGESVRRRFQFSGLLLALVTLLILTGCGESKPASASGTVAVATNHNPVQVVEELSKINLTNATPSAEQAMWFKEQLRLLTAAGTNALPAIRDFLELNADVYFDGPEATQRTGTPSLRVALLEVIGTIGGTNGATELKQILKTSADPMEIGIVARELEKLSPGTYRNECITAAREALSLANSPNWDNRDVAPLLEVITVFGGTNAALELEVYAQKWFVYAPILLGQLPVEATLPTLTRLTQPGNSRLALGRDRFLRALAEAAMKSPAATEVLVALAKADKISPAGWHSVGAALKGNTLQLAHPLLLPAPVTNRPGTRFEHLPMGNQNFYDIPSEPLSAQVLGDRIRFVDSLLADSKNPAAVDALEGARIHFSEQLSKAK